MVKDSSITISTVLAPISVNVKPKTGLAGKIALNLRMRFVFILSQERGAHE